MTSVIYERGQTVVPAKLRKKLGWLPGTSLQWSVVDDGLRVVKLETRQPRGQGDFLKALQTLGAIPAAPRNLEVVTPPAPEAI